MMGFYLNSCDSFNFQSNNYLEQYFRKIVCYFVSISKLDNFFGQFDGIFRRYLRYFVMFYFFGFGLSVSDSVNFVYYYGYVQGGYSVLLIIIVSDITFYQFVSRKISVRYFVGIFQWMIGICIENISLFNSLIDEDN